MGNFEKGAFELVIKTVVGRNRYRYSGTRYIVKNARIDGAKVDTNVWD